MELFNEKDVSELISIRRELHQIAEVGLAEYKTSAFIRQHLQELDNVSLDEVLVGLPTAVIARISVTTTAQTYLYRCELDALQFKEQSGLPYSSQTDCHHACGHDGHMAAMLLAIKIVSRNFSRLKRNLVFCFQPGEEGKGGANKLFNLKPDLLSGIKHSFALHLANHRTVGEVTIGVGNIMPISGRFKVTIKGKGSHVMCPQSAVDANLIGCSIVSQLYTLRTLKLSPLQGACLSIIKVTGGSESAMIADTFQIQGVLRIFSNESYGLLQNSIANIANGMSSMHGAFAKIQFLQSCYRCVYNDAEAVHTAHTALNVVHGIRLSSDQQSFAGEDFCEFSERIPSCYIQVGSALPDSIDTLTCDVCLLRPRAISLRILLAINLTKLAFQSVCKFGCLQASWLLELSADIELNPSLDQYRLYWSVKDNFGQSKIIIMDVCTWPVLNLVLLATASCIRRFSLGMLSLMAVLNMTKSLSLFEICIIQSLVIAANIFLSPLLATLPVKEKYVLLLVACVELMTATVYLQTKDTYITAFCSIFSIAAFSLDAECFTKETQATMVQTLLKQRSLTQDDYAVKKHRHAELNKVIGYIFQALGAFFGGWAIFFTLKTYNTDIQLDSNAIIKLYRWLIYAKILVSFFLTVPATDKKPQTTDALLCTDSDKIHKKQTHILLVASADSFSSVYTHQTLFSYYIYKWLLLFYHEIGKFYLFLNCALALTAISGYFLRHSIRKRAIAYFCLISICTWLSQYQILDLTASGICQFGTYTTLLVLDQELDFALQSPNKQMTGSVLDQRLQWIRLFAKITALLLYVLAFSISNNTPFLNYYLWGMLILRAISTVTVFCVVKQLKGDFEEKLELFEGVEQLDSEQTTGRRL